MKSHVTIARVRGVELGLHFSWIFIALLIVLSLGARFHYVHPEWPTIITWGSAIVTGLLFFVGLFVHELSHAMVAKSRGLPVRRITLFLLGGVAQIEREPQKPATEFWMAIAGPIASVALGFLCLLIAWAGFGWRLWTEIQTPAQAIFVWLGYINLILALFNLIPAFPMDGGRVLRALLWRLTGSSERATTIAARISMVLGWIFVIRGLWQALSGRGIGGLWLAFIGWFLVQAAGSALAQARATSLLRGLAVKDLMSRNCVPVDAGSSVQSFVNAELAGSPGHCYVVLQGGNLAGLLAPRDVRNLPRQRWPQTPVSEVMRPIARTQAVSPETPVNDALLVMGREDSSELPVLSNGSFQGVISRADILRALETRSDLKAA